MSQILQKKCFVDFQNFQNLNFVRGKFLKIRSSYIFPARGPTTIFGPISSAVLTLIGQKQTDRQTDRQAK